LLQNSCVPARLIGVGIDLRALRYHRATQQYNHKKKMALSPNLARTDRNQHTPAKYCKNPSNATE